MRTACRTCGDELLVPFACRGRGFCPSCMGRRMAEGAALLVDHVLPAVGYRQWVLSFEGRMAVRLGYDQALLAKVAEAFARAVMHDMRWSVKERHSLGSVEPLHAGVFTVVQRFRSDLGLYVHLHSLVTDGAFEEAGADARFLPAATPTQGRMTAVLAQVHKAVAAVAEDDLDMDPALAACVQLALAGPHAVPPQGPAARPSLTVSAFDMHLHAARVRLRRPERSARPAPARFAPCGGVPRRSERRLAGADGRRDGAARPRSAIGHPGGVPRARQRDPPRPVQSVFDVADPRWRGRRLGDPRDALSRITLAASSPL